MKLIGKAGATGQTFNVFVADSSSTTGGGLTGLAYNTAGLTAYYALPRAAPVAITLATQTVTGAWSPGGFVEISAATMPGWYRFDPPDAAFVAGNAFVDFHLGGAADMAPLPIEVDLGAAAVIADAILSRDVANVESTMPEHCLGTVILATLQWGPISGLTWPINRTDGVTVHASKSITVSGGQITGVS